MKGRLVRGGTWLLRFLPKTVAIAMALVVADVSWLVLRNRRKTIEGNLRYIAPNRTRAEHRRLGRQTFRNLARCTIDFLRIPLMTPAQIRSMFDERGHEHLDQAVARGNGVILISAHVGNFELATAWLAARGYPLHIVAEDTDVGQHTYETYARYRGATGTNVIPLSRGALNALRALKKGGVVGLLSDRLLTAHGPVIDFCGGRRQLPSGAAVLARQSGATVLLGAWTLTETGDRPYRSVIEPLHFDRAQTDDRMTQAIANGLAHIVKQHPDQWFVFQPEWLDADVLPNSRARIGRRHRA